jgi:hypothetical protein
MISKAAVPRPAALDWPEVEGQEEDTGEEGPKGRSRENPARTEVTNCSLLGRIVRRSCLFEALLSLCVLSVQLSRHFCHRDTLSFVAHQCCITPRQTLCWILKTQMQLTFER